MLRRNREAAGRDPIDRRGEPPTDAWLFAQSLLGNQIRVLCVPRANVTEADLFAQDMLGKSHEDPTAPEYVVVSEAWLFAQAILGKPVDDSLLRSTPAAREQNLRKAPWNPADHPRGSFSQNRGWFSPTAGAGAETSTSSRKDVFAQGVGRSDGAGSLLYGNGDKPMKQDRADYLAAYDEKPKQGAARGDGEADAKKGYTENKWIERATGTETKAGGTVKLDDGSSVRIRAFNGVTANMRENGKWVKEPDGKLKEVPDLVQFEATGPDCDKLHWIQFYRETLRDDDGDEIEGGAKTRGYWAEFGKWHLDATAPPQGERPAAHSVYYDNPDADNAYARSKTSLSIFDRGSGSELAHYDAATGVINFKTYLTDGEKVLWEASWNQSTKVGAKGEQEISNGSFKGRAVNALSPELDTPQWSVGHRIVGEGENKQTSVVPTELPNPFVK